MMRHKEDIINLKKGKSSSVITDLVNNKKNYLFWVLNSLLKEIKQQL